MRRHKVNEKLFLVLPFNVYNWYEEFNRTIEDLTVGCDVIFTQILGQNANEIKL
jgi:hypothetical protein